MKKVRILLTLAVLTLCAVLLPSCGKKEVTAKGYGLVHKDYVGIATVTVKKDVVKEASFEEVYLPTHWAALTTTDGVDASLFVTYAGKRGDVNVAKYIKIDGKTFTATVNEAGDNVAYSAEGIADIKAYVSASEENAKWYAEALLAGKAEAVDAAGAKVTFQITSDKEGGFTKSATGYWSGENYPLGWKGNMEALADAIEGTKLDAADSAIVQDATTKTWKFGDVTSTATLVDAKDYYAVAKRAYANATK